MCRYMILSKTRGQQQQTFHRELGLLRQQSLVALCTCVAELLRRRAQSARAGHTGTRLCNAKLPKFFFSGISIITVGHRLLAFLA